MLREPGGPSRIYIAQGYTVTAQPWDNCGVPADVL